MHNTLPLLEKHLDFPAILRSTLETLQVNLGYLCNQSCLHCHVNAGPKRKELMDSETVDQVIDFLNVSKVATLDLTGGAPEMNPHFQRLVKAAREPGVTVIDRCNLTILEEEGYGHMADFLAENQVDIIASLPCYMEDNVNRQRGDGVFNKSISALKRLNQLGYGMTNSPLNLTLVFNPQGPVLPPAQKQLELDYREHLKEEYGVYFTQLFTITNMPIQRFGSTLVSKGLFDEYMKVLKDNYMEENLSSVMCRSLISVDWQGYVYDCDFNQMLDIHTPLGRKHITEITPEKLNRQSISVLDHCYGCTAGQGSSCGGALES